MTGKQPNPPQHLQKRRDPNQDRSRESVARIMKASADLLIEHGVEKLTTRRIAASAKVNIATLYQFFPNKQSIVYALYEEWVRVSREVFHRADQNLSEAKDWRPFFIEFLSGLADVGFSAELESRLTQAVGVYKYLHEFEHEYQAWGVKRIVGYIRHFSPDSPAERARAVAAVLLEWDMALVNLEMNYSRPVQKHIHNLSMEGMLHLLEVCIKNKPIYEGDKAKKKSSK